MSGGVRPIVTRIGKGPQGGHSAGGAIAVDDSRHAEFLRLFTAHEQAIRAHVRRLVPLRSDADDLMQEIAVVLWRKFADFRSDAGFRPWAFGVAKYEILAWRRDRARDRVALSGEIVAVLADESARDDAALGRHREFLDLCIGKLDRGQRELLLAAYDPAVRIHDVAARSGRSVGGFYQWLHRMRRLLLDCIEAELRRSGEA